MRGTSSPSARSRRSVAIAYSRKCSGRAVALRQHEARVVDDERVRHDEVRPAVHGRPVRQVVAVALGVVDEAALLDHELARVDAHLARVPAERPAAGGLLDRRDGPADGLALLVAGHLEAVRPAVAVRGALVAAGRELAGDGRVALQGGRDAEEGDGDAGGVEDAEQAPDAGPRPVLVDGLDGEVADAVELERDLVQDVVLAVAHREGLLGALLVVDDDLHRDLRVALPADARRVLAVAHELARAALDAGQVVVAEELLVHRAASTAAQAAMISAESATSAR